MNTNFKNSVAVIALMPVLLVTGCSLAENHLKFDRDNNLEVQDVRDAMSPREIPAEVDAKATGNNIPEFQDYAADTAQDLKPMPMVTISVNETIPLKDVLYELAQQANYDVELDPRIDGAVIFSARNRPFDQVMERIADMAGLRYTLKDSTIRIELDTPYTQTYKIDYLPVIRKTQSDVKNDVTISGSDSATESATGSTFKMSGSTEIDFWKELDTNIKQILESNSPENALRTAQTPQLATAPAAPPVAPNTPPAAPTAGSAGSPGGSASGGEGAPSVNTQGIANNSNVPPIPPAVVASANQPAAAAAPSVAPADNKVNFTPTYSLNRQAGLVSVFANDKVHRKIKSYLDELRRSVGSQVLIEAKVFEVSLSDEFATGINWDSIDLPTKEFNLSFTSGTPALPVLSPGTSAGFNLGYTGGSDLNAVIQAVSRYGTVHALASPRLTVINNQSAVLNVAKNHTYFELKVDVTTQDNTTKTTVDSTAKSVPEGVLVNVTPSIDLENNQVTMSVRPTISRIDSSVADPGVAFVIANSGLTGTAAANLQNLVPNVSVQEFDSVVKIKSGDVVIMGGLLQDRTESEQSGVPVLAEAPLFGGLFRKQQDKISKTELVVFLKATILDNAGQTIHQTDRDLYRIFSQDRRPLPL